MDLTRCWIRSLALSALVGAACGGRTVSIDDVDDGGIPTPGSGQDARDSLSDPQPPLIVGVPIQDADMGGCRDTVVEARPWMPMSTCEIEIPPFPEGARRDFAYVSLERLVGGAFSLVPWVGTCTGGVGGWLVVKEGRGLLCPSACPPSGKVEAGQYRFIFRCGNPIPQTQRDSGLLMEDPSKR
jgi:hypothetical protein